MSPSLASSRSARLFALAIAAGAVACTSSTEEPGTDGQEGVTADIDTSTVEPRVDNTPPPPKPPPPSPGGCRVTCRVCPNPSGCGLATANCQTKTLSCNLAILCCPSTNQL